MWNYVTIHFTVIIINHLKTNSLYLKIEIIIDIITFLPNTFQSISYRFSLCSDRIENIQHFFNTTYYHYTKILVYRVVGSITSYCYFCYHRQ